LRGSAAGITNGLAYGQLAPDPREAQAELDKRRAYTGTFNYDNAELRVISRSEAKKEFGKDWEYTPIGGNRPKPARAKKIGMEDKHVRTFDLEQDNFTHESWGMSIMPHFDVLLRRFLPRKPHPNPYAVSASLPQGAGFAG